MHFYSYSEKCFIKSSKEEKIDRKESFHVWYLRKMKYINLFLGSIKRRVLEMFTNTIQFSYTYRGIFQYCNSETMNIDSRSFFYTYTLSCIYFPFPKMKTLDYKNIFYYFQFLHCNRKNIIFAKYIVSRLVFLYFYTFGFVNRKSKRLTS